jgi:hypothetical protein
VEKVVAKAGVEGKVAAKETGVADDPDRKRGLLQTVYQKNKERWRYARF